MPVMKAGVIGCGNIGAALCAAMREGAIPATLAAVADEDSSRAEALAKASGAEALDLEGCARTTDFLVECASGAVVPDVLRACARHGRDCLIMSLGGLLDQQDLLASARAEGVGVHLPAGALAGLDGLRAAMEAGVESVTLTTRKPPQGLAGAPYLEQQGIALDGLTEARIIFEGNALEAVQAFPKNVNVAAALSLAGPGPEAVTVRVVADPAAEVNSHEVVVTGAFGRMTCVTENMPSPQNPKTSYLAVLSARAELRAAALAFARREGARA